MPKRVSFWSSIAIVIIVAWLPVAAFIWVAGTFQPVLPNVTWSVVSILAGLFSLELASQIGPKPFESPLHQIIGKLSNSRDKVIMVLSLIAGFVVIYLPRTVGMGFGWLNIVFMLMGLLLIYALWYVLGTDELRNEIFLLKKRKNQSFEQDGNG